MVVLINEIQTPNKKNYDYISCMRNLFQLIVIDSVFHGKLLDTIGVL